MSTKNLARTVIEGGRTGYSKAFRRGTHRTMRARERAWCDHLLKDPADWDATLPPAAVHAGRDFNDRLGPAQRWLERHVGHRWDEVYAELRALFDLRTIPGRHIVIDHIVPWVKEGWRFRIDDDGLLRAMPRRPRRRGRVWDDQRLVAWLAGRRVGRRGACWFWFVETQIPVRAYLPPGLVPARRWRQDRRLRPDEAARWLGFSEAARAAVKIGET